MTHPPTTLSTYDLSPTDQYDLRADRGRNDAWAEVHLVSALQGIVNRTAPHLYVTYVSDDPKRPARIDRFWLEHLRGRPDGWLRHTRLAAVPTLEALVGRFRREIRGVVLYDRSVPATSNVASTVAGCEDLLPVPYDTARGSVYDRLVVHGPRLPVRVRLIGDDGAPRFTGAETGSAKCDAYRWALRTYLETGRCDPGRLGYYLDAHWLRAPDKAPPNCHGLSNHDYFIARRAFFFDLSPWDDENPQDDPNQPQGTDFRTLLTLLRAAYERTRGERMIHVGGFVPWAWKYTETAGGGHGDVATEWRYAAILSCFNAYMDADALSLNAMANASVFAHAPRRKPPAASPPRRSAAPATPPPPPVLPRTYVAFYSGDYDSAAWLYQRLPDLWTDPARGTVPLGWAFNPNLAERFPVGLDWAQATATPNDHFIAGDSGAGYLNPGYLDGYRPYSRLPSGLAVWERHCQTAYRAHGITMTGFVIDGDARPMSPETLAAYARFSPDGIVAQRLPARQGLVPGTHTPYLVMGSDMPGGDQIDEALRRIREDIAAASPLDTKKSGPRFHIFRTILWAPSQHKALFTRLREAEPEIIVVDPVTLMGLLRDYLRGAGAG